QSAGLQSRLRRPAGRAKARRLHFASVAWTAYWLQAGEALLDGWECGELSVRLGLIPIRYRIEVVGAMVGVAVLNGGAERLGEGDRRIEVETIDGATASGTFFTLYRCAEEPV